MVTVYKEKFLDDFNNAVVTSGKYEKIPYKIWRTIKNSSDTLTIERTYNYNGISQYTIHGAAPLCIVPANDKSLGNFIYDTVSFPVNDYINLNTTDSLSINDLTSISNGLISTYTSVSAGVNTVTDSMDTFREKIEELTNTVDKLVEKKEQTMNTNSIIKFDFGRLTGGQFRWSPNGLAIATEKGWVAYKADTEELIDADVFSFDISNMLYKVPTPLKDVKAGNVIYHMGRPVFVRKINDSTISVVDYETGSIMDILPIKSPFGFNFVTKVVSVVDFRGAKADADNPFGSMLPFLLLGEQKDFDPTMFYLLQGNSLDSNMLLLLSLVGNNNKSKDMLLPLLFMNMNQESAKAVG